MTRPKSMRKAFMATLMSVAMLAMTAAQVLADGSSGPFPK